MLIPPPIVIGLLPAIMPFMTPSEASFIIAVTMPDEDGHPQRSGVLHHGGYRHSVIPHVLAGSGS